MGRTVQAVGEMLLARMPLVRNLYSGLKQIFQTALSESNRSFNSAGLIWAGVIFFSLLVLFSILTLPVEIGASRRALVMLRENGLMQTSEDEEGVKRVLTAAAMTYVAAAVTAPEIVMAPETATPARVAAVARSNFRKRGSA